MLNGSVKQTTESVKQNYFTWTVLNISVKQTFHPLNKQVNPLNRKDLLNKPFELLNKQSVKQTPIV
jgi:hypothetical protein